MQDNDIIEAIKNFTLPTTVEVTPGGAQKIDDFRTILPENSTVFVTFLPGSDFADTSKTIAKLQQHKMYPVPHLAARSIPSKDFLEEQLKILTQEYGVEECLLIGGGVDNPIGDFSETMQIIRTGLLEKYHIKKIGLAGHPEGSPDITPEQCTKALAEKNDFAKDSNIDCYITTQFCFEIAPILQWEKTIRDAGNQLPIHIGVPGLATIKTLFKHAQACGIGASMRVISRQAANITKLMTQRQPDELVRNLAIATAQDTSILIKKMHLYPLGGLAKSAKWLDAVKAGNITLTKKGFKTPEIA